MPESSDSAISRKPGRPRDPEIHRRVLDVARRLLDEVGYLELTMDKIASQAEVTRKTLYHWWPGKAALVGELMVHDSIVDEVPDLGSTREELRLLFAQILRDATPEGGRGRLSILWASMGDASVLDEYRRDVLGPRRRYAVAVIQRGIGRGDLPPDIDTDFFMDMWSGTVLFRRAMRSSPIYDDQVEQLVEMALGGQVPRLPRAGRQMLSAPADEAPGTRIDVTTRHGDEPAD